MGLGERLGRRRGDQGALSPCRPALGAQTKAEIPPSIASSRLTSRAMFGRVAEPPSEMRRAWNGFAGSTAKVALGTAGSPAAIACAASWLALTRSGSGNQR